MKESALPAKVEKRPHPPVPLTPHSRVARARPWVSARPVSPKPSRYVRSGVGRCCPLLAEPGTAAPARPGVLQRGWDGSRLEGERDGCCGQRGWRCDVVAGELGSHLSLWVGTPVVSVGKLLNPKLPR